MAAAIHIPLSVHDAGCQAASSLKIGGAIVDAVSIDPVTCIGLVTDNSAAVHVDLDPADAIGRAPAPTLCLVQPPPGIESW